MVNHVVSVKCSIIRTLADLTAIFYPFPSKQKHTKISKIAVTMFYIDINAQFIHQSITIILSLKILTRLRLCSIVSR